MASGVEVEDASDRGAEEDAAWVLIETPLSPAGLRRFIDDVERLYRINPLLEFSDFTPLGDNRFNVALHNLSNGLNARLVLRVDRDAHVVRVNYSEGLKSSTTFRVEAAGPRARLLIRDDYAGTPKEERKARIGEVDRSLPAWGRALHGYLRRWARWGWLPPWRWYMARAWQPMKPSARRVVYVLWIIALFEVLTLLVAVMVWVLAARPAG